MVTVPAIVVTFPVVLKARVVTLPAMFAMDLANAWSVLAVQVIVTVQNAKCVAVANALMPVLIVVATTAGIVA